nr:hypothetical protein [Tanacetum cinerariifolium]
MNQVTHTSEPSRCFNSICYDDYDYEESIIPLSDIIFQIPSSIVITTSPHVLSIKDPEVFLIMENEDLSTIPKKESDEFIKSSAEDLVPILSESKDTSGNNRKMLSFAKMGNVEQVGIDSKGFLEFFFCSGSRQGVVRLKGGNGYQQKGKNEAKTDKTEHEMEKRKIVKVKVN